MNPDLTIVLLGSSGVGKSASGNTILGRTAFESRQSFTSVTTEISEEAAEVFGKRISVIDTPGILQSEWEIQTRCQNLLQSSRPCLFLVVFRLGPFTREQTKVLTAAIRVLGPQGFKNCHLLFTGGDALRGTLEDFVFGDEESSPPATFSGRCHLFNNENGGQDQVRELLMKTGHLRAPELPAHLSPNLRIVLLGPPGGGRSSTGNTILGSDQFIAAGGFNPVSTQSLSKSASMEGRWITVVDSAGLTQVLSPQQLHTNIMESMEKASPGPHAIVFVIKIGNIPTADIQLFELLPQVFNRDARSYSMVLFTHGDELEGRSVDVLIRSNGYVSNLVSMCGGRYCVFDNRNKRNRAQVRNLLQRIDEMVTVNGGQHFNTYKFRMPQSKWESISLFVKNHIYKIIVIVSLGLFVIVRMIAMDE